MNANQNTTTTIVAAILDPNETIFALSLLKGCNVEYKKNPLGLSVSYFLLGRDNMRLIAKPPTDSVMPIIMQNIAEKRASSVNLYVRNRNKVAENIRNPIPNAYSHRTKRSGSICLGQIYAADQFQSVILDLLHTFSIEFVALE